MPTYIFWPWYYINTKHKVIIFEVICVRSIFISIFLFAPFLINYLNWSIIYSSVKTSKTGYFGSSWGGFLGDLVGDLFFYFPNILSLNINRTILTIITKNVTPPII